MSSITPCFIRQFSCTEELNSKMTFSKLVTKECGETEAKLLDFVKIKNLQLLELTWKKKNNDEQELKSMILEAYDFMEDDDLKHYVFYHCGTSSETTESSLGSGKERLRKRSAQSSMTTTTFLKVKKQKFFIADSNLSRSQLSFSDDDNDLSYDDELDEATMMHEIVMRKRMEYFLTKHLKIQDAFISKLETEMLYRFCLHMEQLYAFFKFVRHNEKHFENLKAVH
ncbi:unnamed protein product [Didymodactylos carnosus]|uniref:Uncharacterized protein n=1 Tax=Didymodactylos carnosus TaxID=1234261 RepID=A0A815GIV6_9BILA|nr:unnamed protein product [Didymodactylos carnosus]CAF1339184.1 unnamed protein product [Didymodactylos carnosus]CAF3848081.1 unnamed protein product [Didymodactylos carnosus]CAF4198714.1 unnamed protein product [Didymodactylos carnosus]